MPRRAREVLRTSFFHVMVQGVNKEFIFKQDKYKQKYLKFLKLAKEKHEIDIIAYAIMNNHTHLLLHTNKLTELSEFMKKVNEDYGRYYNYVEDRIGHVFRDRYLSEPITNQKYLLSCMAYIHNNPVKANIVDKCENYKYSSYLDYLNMSGFIDKKIIELVFGNELLSIEEFEIIHKKKTFYFADCDNTLEQIMNDIIKELEVRYRCKNEKIKNNPKVLKDIVIEIKERTRISNSNMARYLKISRNKISKILSDYKLEE